jgi:hypothetical protein
LTLLTVKSLISRNIPGLLRGFMPPKDSEQGLVGYSEYTAFATGISVDS